MKPTIVELQAGCPSVERRFLARHLERLGDDYFQTFAASAVCAHVRAIARLSPKEPVHILIEDGEEGRVDCTVVAFDYPSEFALITGTLSGTGFEIVSGDVFTYTAPPPTVRHARRTGRASRPDAQDALLRRRCIIDRFRGVRLGETPRGEWETLLRERLARVVELLERGGDAEAQEARHLVNEQVALRLRDARADARPILYPVEIDIPESSGPYTTLRVRSQDTPAFLYSLSNALSLQGFSIERVRIQTIQGRVRDEIDILDSRGGKIADSARLDQIKLAVLLTKQFTYFLTRAPDPYTALCRFEQMVRDVVSLPERGRWLDLFSRPEALGDLARILGTSDFIWEDFVRTQYEELLPLLSPRRGADRRGFSRAELERRLEEAMGAEDGEAGVSRPLRGDGSPEACPPFTSLSHMSKLEGERPREPSRSSPLETEASLAGALRRLNEWKDREIFLIDLDHILHAGADARALEEPLTDLAEIVVRRATDIVYRSLVGRHGVPRTVGGLEARFAIFGLGKFGGVALGYASDIELLFVYSDNGETDGAARLTNAEFFERLAVDTAAGIAAKREGIFHVDLRLRPHGESGPKACSLEHFCRYYPRSGEAHSYERLALTRLRAIGGDPELGRQVERLRDEFVYQSDSIRREELQALRERQFGEKVKDRRHNAKFSQGALVDLEYYVQILQVTHGRTHPELRTPRMHEVLAALSSVGVLEPGEADRLTDAYYFLRRLINGLRMLRGSARDLFLPSVDSDEFVHLARRMGYERQKDLEPAQQLFLDFELKTATIRTFVERHFGREALPGPVTGNVADLVLSDSAPSELRGRILSEAGFRDAERGYTNLRRLGGGGSRRELFAPLAVLAFDRLRHEPDPDMALNNWERYLGSLANAERHYQLLFSQPKRLEILLGIFSRSQFLADTVIRNPEFLDWVTAPENLHKKLERAVLEAEIETQGRACGEDAAWQDMLRRLRRRELLRIGTRDMCLRAPIRDVTADLSTVAESVIACALRRAIGSPADARADRFCVLAFGKLGGRELNYSSDVDLLGVYGSDPAEGAVSAEFFGRIMDGLRRRLSDHTEEGYCYRVDLRLRPYGSAGEMASSADSIVRYYERSASLWEVQALLKMRPVAGNPAVGNDLLDRLRATMLKPRSAEDVVRSIRTLREAALRQQARKGADAVDVKSGFGGIREIEFLVQGLQLIHAPRHPELIAGNTLDALEILKKAGQLPEATANHLAEDYVFLRRVEHFLQIMEDRQIHVIPREPAELEALGKRMMGPDADIESFGHRLHNCLRRVRRTFDTHLA